MTQMTQEQEQQEMRELRAKDHKALEQDDATHPLKRAYNGLGYVVYKRTYARNVPGENRTEEWRETVQRVVAGALDIGAGLTQAEAYRLYDHIWNLRAIPSGRMLWQLGTENVERLGGDSMVSCWYTNLRHVNDYVWLFNRLMLGGGVGFSVAYGANLGPLWPGRVRATKVDGFDADFVVPDNREGWGELLRRVLECNLNGDSFTYSVDAVRPEGAAIKTFGGKASGPGALVDGVNAIQKIFDKAGLELGSTDVLDIANIIGGIVVSGNVRRSAQIAQGAANDVHFLSAKRWDLGAVPNHRAMSNNSVVVNTLDEFNALPEEFWAGYEGNGEAYGMLNVANARMFGRMYDPMPDSSVDGFNPCSEIALADREACNLGELVLPHFDSYAQLQDAATLLYKVQKAVAGLDYIDGRSNAVVHANMRLGLGVTGVMEATVEQLEWLPNAYNFLRAVDKTWSAQRGWPESVRLTTVKPSGTLSLLAGVLPGGHPGFAKHHVRRVRMAANDPVLTWCKAQGYPWEWVRGFDGKEDTRTAVVEFPVELPDHAKLAEDTSALDQLDMVQWLQTNWADNSVSVTVYFEPEELRDIRYYLSHQWDKFKSLSFLRRSDHGFDQAPLEAISVAEYDQRLAALGHQHIDVEGEAVDILDSDCETGVCPVK